MLDFFMLATYLASFVWKKVFSESKFRKKLLFLFSFL